MIDDTARFDLHRFRSIDGKVARLENRVADVEERMLLLEQDLAIAHAHRVRHEAAFAEMRSHLDRINRRLEIKDDNV